MKNKLTQIFKGSFSRYLVVGAGTSLLDFCLFTLLSVGVHINVVVANICSTIITVCVSYFINQRFVFRSQRSSWKTFFSFAGWTLFTGLVVQTIIIWGLVHLGASLNDLACTPANPESPWCHCFNPDLVKPLAKICAMGTGALANYFGYRFLFTAKK